MALLEVEWEQLEPLLDPDEAVRRNQLVDEPSSYERGDLERGLAEADVVVEAEFRTQTVVHNSMETHQAVCVWEGDDHLTVYISTQFVWGIRENVAEHFGLPQDNVRVVCEFMGGGFGSKNSADASTYVAAELARMTGRPVKCMLTRREENLDAGNRNATIQRLRAGARADGTLTALDGEFVNSNGFGGWLASTGGPMRMLYALRERQDRRVRRQAQHPADEGLPSAGLRRGHLRPRVPDGRARRKARPRPSGAPPTELHTARRDG